jgi:aspartyl protease family protein
MNHKLLLYALITVLAISFTACRHRNRERNNSRQTRRSEKVEIPETSRKTTESGANSVVKMRKAGGVYYVPCKINGTEMEFIFDTGASDITMSLTEAIFLYKQGKLTDKDFIGMQQYQIADGSIHEGAIVVLRKVEIGDWMLSNVKASIVNNMEAPLLLGQSALAKFGKISINYNRNEITFE